MGFGFILVGLAFLFNPNMNIIDVLPDFLGYGFIIVGLGKMSDLNHRIMASRKNFMELFLISLVKFAMIAFIPSVDGTLVLVLTFSFAILEIVLIIFAFDQMFEGISSLTLTIPNDIISVFKNFSNAKSLTMLFLIIKSVLSVLPELTSLSTADYLGEVTVSAPFNIADYKNIIIIANIVVTTIIGIVWFVVISKYFIGIKNDKNFMDILKNKYNTEILPNTALFTRREIKLGFTMLGLGFVFMLDLIIDGIDIFPDIIGILLIIIGLLTLKKYCNLTKLSLIVTSIYGGLSTVIYLASIYFAIHYYYIDIKSVPEAVNLNYMIKFGSIFENIFFIVVLWIITVLLIEIMKKHTPTNYNKEFIKRINIGFIITILCTLVNIAAAILANVFDAFWIINFAITIIWIFYMIKTLYLIYEQIDYKYL